ncbi:ribulose-5-phosphate 4-epimerase-like epimerase or aldolase [Desulfosporosinus acidiphilus SJ4]|uniref:Ribulose-5-phosphate 4-epimerase-like epimerase or aldolase n=1 Tax=Desulfosporosinus acidiphilus (strain DSM 22704 / JCM 16185 / SJ4) TaxID=646529 RepID=I4D620_DESAJ|nr:class II aldolase/adducin family protein [Desulfosporosinus acidiphilus]AFM41244.1 ribulose-5-phosphate 4-epimerase-like epimerase or aldolase [Desulfosporosinus acidiphilus SJ4]
MDQIIFARQNVVDIGKEILSTKLTVGTWGNISCRVPNHECFVITPTGMNYDILTHDDIVVMDYKGDRLAGSRLPSIELPLHLAIYHARPDVQAIIHTHSAYATAVAAARKEIPGAVEDLVQIVGGNVRVNEYAPPGSKQLGLNTVKALEGRNAVLLANHGMLGVGSNLDEALKVCQIVEKAAKITIFAQLLGGVVELSSEDIEGMRNFYLHSYGQR